MMRIAVYVRVSTPNQVHQQPIDQQLDRLRAHLEAEGLALTDPNIFRDDGYSGARLNRTGLVRLRDAIRERRIDRVVLTAPDRLARNYVHQMLLLEEFESHGIQVDFLDRPMTQAPYGYRLHPDRPRDPNGGVLEPGGGGDCGGNLCALSATGREPVAAGAHPERAPPSVAYRQADVGGCHLACAGY